LAITKVFPIHSHLKQAIRYAINPDKTENGTLTNFFNCRADAAYKNMVDTQKRFNQWNKRNDGVQGHHLIQSFKPHEATPEIAKQIAEEFVHRYLAKGYEVVYGIHTDHDHLHVHYIFNAVSFVDGHKYRNNKKEYREQIRPLSDELCAKHGLSVIRRPEEKKTLHYGEWRLKQAGGVTWKELIQRDIDELIQDANDFHDFVSMMQDAGYAVKQGKHIAFKPYGKERFVRGYTLGKAYTAEAIQDRIDASFDASVRYHLSPSKAKTLPHSVRGKRQRLTGLQAYYFKLLYAMGKVKRSVPSQKTHALYRKELEQVEQHRQLYGFIIEHDIKSPAELSQFAENKQAELDALKAEKETLKPDHHLKLAFRNLKILKTMQDGYDMYMAGNPALMDEYEQYLKAKRNLEKLGYGDKASLETLIQKQKDINRRHSELAERMQDCQNDLKACGKIAVMAQKFQRDYKSLLIQPHIEKGVSRPERYERR